MPKASPSPAPPAVPPLFVYVDFPSAPSIGLLFPTWIWFNYWIWLLGFYFLIGFGLTLAVKQHQYWEGIRRSNDIKDFLNEVGIKIPVGGSWRGKGFWDNDNEEQWQRRGILVFFWIYGLFFVILVGFFLFFFFYNCEVFPNI